MKLTAARVLRLLAEYESPNVLWVDREGGWPIVWERARGAEVWDISGRKYLDLTAAFGVAAAGHANPRVVAAGQKQMARLPHAMGDVHPHARKAELARGLSRLTFERWSRGRTTGKTIFCNSGFEAVEAALKTALLATGKPGVIAFAGAYHGLGYGALNATHREHFRGPFQSQLARFGHFVSFPRTAEELPVVERAIRELMRAHEIGAVIVEPVQARGGMHVPPPGFLRRLREVCDRAGVILILDEIYTGFGRTGRWFACEHEKMAPDLICVGKALAGGFPISACVGAREIIDRAWPPSTGEAIHTSTFLGNPVGCAMALAQMAELARRKLPQRSAALGKWLLNLLRAELKSSRFDLHIRGQGLMAGVEVCERDGGPATAGALGAVKELLAEGFIFLPEGAEANVISLTPPLTITRRQLQSAVRALARVLA